MSYPIDTHDGQVQIERSETVVAKSVYTVAVAEDGTRYVRDPRTTSKVWITESEAESLTLAPAADEKVTVADEDPEE